MFILLDGIFLTISSMPSFILPSVLLVNCKSYMRIIFNVVAVGTRAVSFPEEGDHVELHTRKTPGSTLWGLQPGWLS